MPTQWKTCVTRCLLLLLHLATNDAFIPHIDLVVGHLQMKNLVWLCKMTPAIWKGLSQTGKFCKYLSIWAGYTSEFVCYFMSDLLQIADAIWSICDLVSHTELLPFTRSMRYGVAIWCCDLLCDLVRDF
jgi:hypothetical protein